MRGLIDSGFDLTPIAEFVDGVKLIIDVSKLQKITDLGRRAWRRNLDHLCDHAEEVLLWDCPPELTTQFNATPALLSMARVVSYRLRHDCSACEAAVWVRVNAATLEAADLDPEHLECSANRPIDFRDNQSLTELRKHSANTHSTASVQDTIAKLLRSPPRLEGTGTTVPTRERSRLVPAALRRSTHFSRNPVRHPWKARITPTAPVLGGFVVTVFLGGFTMGYAFRPATLPKSVIVDFAVSLNDGRFDTAKRILNTYQDKLPDLLVDIYRFELESAQNEAADIYRRQAQRAFRRQHYDDAVGYAVEAIAIDDSDRDMVFLLADAHRLSGRKEEAVEYYKTFIEGSPGDELTDDAMYWYAEVLIERGQHDEARNLLNQVLARRQSNFRRSASRLLAELP